MIDGRLPEPGASLAGYAALIQQYKLEVPIPERLAAISSKHKKYETDKWSVFTPRYSPENTLASQLTFALKYEGVDLAILKCLFGKVEQSEVVAWIKSEPNGSYARRVWFLYEWLLEELLDLPDLKKIRFIDLLDPKMQYGASPRSSRRHGIRNNLPGTRDFCPLIRRTERLDHYLSLDLPNLAKETVGSVHPDVLMRAAAFLLLNDSKASYAIEGETPPHSRTERWARIIGSAGQTSLSKQELELLQKAVITDTRFVKLGFREEGGFVGTHDRLTQMPIPDHISARHDHLGCLMGGLIEASKLLKESDFPPVLTATTIAFGFVFIHPFEDGNGRIHRYLLHHVLAETGFTPKGMVFPVSSVILERLLEYKAVLESHSRPRLPLIEWRPTEKNNVTVLNDTIDLYRYFDATRQAEFLYGCVFETITKVLPEEVRFLQKYDRMKSFIDNYLDMPWHIADLLIRFLNQNNGKFSNRALTKEFASLTADEIQAFESTYAEIFGD
jgi:hypothetical protein